MTPPPVVLQESSALQRDDLRGRRWWAVSGVVTGLTGLGVSQFLSELLTVKQTPLAAVVDSIAHVTPGSVAQATVEFLATLATPFLLVLAVLVPVVLFAVGGVLWRRSAWLALPLWVALAGAELAAGLGVNGPGAAQVVPVGIGLLIWIGGMAMLAPRLARHDEELADEASEQRAEEATGEYRAGDDAGPRPLGHARRGVLAGLALTALIGFTAGGGTWWLERRRAAVRESRRLLRIPGVTRPRLPDGAEVGLEGIAPWMTPTDDFHTVSTALRVPALEASQWSLNIHGQVRTPMVLTYDDLLARGLVEAWVTLASVTNSVGGSLVDNAWWSGVATRVLLEEVGVLDGADAVLQTSADGSERLTPLDALTDDRSSMLAVAMNGAALQIEHGFPVCSVVPGHYEESSSCKWVIDWEVTRAVDVDGVDDASDWAGSTPVRLASRVDVPREGETVEAEFVQFGGVAWHPGTGIERVEFAVDGGPWSPAGVADIGEDDAWVQWRGRARLAPGEHAVRVRAVNRRGEVQSAVVRDPLPRGATGWHEVTFTVEEPEDD